tara:strand:- start:1037 stop:1234 length:198 start_codon:yes stop_codon:yes gene_type:complete
MGMLIAEKLFAHQSAAEMKLGREKFDLEQSKLPSQKKFQANMTPQQKAEAARKRNVSITQAGKQI